MRVVTMVSLGASAALGVAALFVARTFLPSNTTSTAEAATAAAVKDLRPVVLAAHPLVYGARIEAKDLVLAQVPSKYVPEGAFPTIQAVLTQDKGAPPVVISAIAEKEAVLPAKVTGPGARPSVAIQIAEGKRAYAIRVNDVASVGGNILPGDRVDVLLTRNLNKADGPPNMVAEVVIQNVRLLGLDLNVDPASTATKVSSTATVEVTMQDGQKLSMVSTLGTLSLALRRTGEAKIDGIKAMRTSDLHLVGGYSIGAAPASAAPADINKPIVPRGPTIVVVNGDKRETIVIPTESSRGGI